MEVTQLEVTQHMQAGGGGATLAIACWSLVFGYVTGPVVSWLSDISPGWGALIGTVVVGVFSVTVREAVGWHKWRVERRDAAAARKRS